MRTSIALALLALVVFPARAEKVDTPPDKMREAATHVVAGKITAIYARVVTHGNYTDTHYAASVKVSAVEKGPGIAANDLVFVRYWSRRDKRATGAPGTSGHAIFDPKAGLFSDHRLPVEGDVLRFYLVQNAYDGADPDNKDGGFNVYFRNGFERLPAAEPPK